MSEIDDEFDDIEDDVEETELIADMDSLVEESKNLLDKLYHTKEHEVTRIMSQDDLRNDVSCFVSSQLKNLENQNTLKSLLEAEIAKKVMTHDLSNAELFDAYRMISSEKSRNIDSLFKLFAPTQTTPNTILTPATKEEENTSVEMSASERQAVEKLIRVINAKRPTEEQGE